MNTVWIINQHASTPELGIGGRHYYLAKELAKQNHKVYLIAASYTHLLREEKKMSSEYVIETITEGFEFVWIKMPTYVGAHNKRRALSWFEFSLKLLKLPKVISERPDSILYSSPSLIPFLGAQYLAKKFNAKLAFEVRDIWPLTFTELGNYSPRHPFIRFMQWVEDRAYRDADVVFSNLSNAVEHMVERGMDRTKFVWVPNGVNLVECDNPEPLSADMQSVIPNDKFLVGYVGTLGLTNALESYIGAASLLQDDHTIHFLLVGNGKDKAKLLKQAKGLANLTFFDAIPKLQVQSLLARFDVCYISQTKSRLYRFGISPMKLPEYMLARKPILHSTDFEKLVETLNMGLVVPAEDPHVVADAILRIKSMSKEAQKIMGENSRAYALENYDYAKLAEKLALALFPA